MHKIILLILLSFSFLSFAQQNIVELKEEFSGAIINKDYDLLVSSAKKLELNFTGNQERYYIDVLKRLPENAILITNNLEDTYGLLCLQLYRKYKTSVSVISLGLMNSSSKYASTILSKHKIDASFDKASPSIYLSRILKESKQKVFISLTVSPGIYVKYQKELFITGLSLEHKSTNHYQDLVGFNESIKEVLSTVQHLTIEKKLYTNYLPPLFTLYKMKVERWGESKKIRYRILWIAKYLEIENGVKELLKTYEK